MSLRGAQRPAGLLRQGRFAECAEQCRALLAEGVRDPKLRTLRAGALLLAGDAAGGWRELERAYQEDPRELSRYAEATEGFASDRAAAASPDDNEWHGVSESVLLAALDAALGARPALAEAWAWRGLLRRYVRDYAGAVADIGRALELGLESPDLWTWRGEARLHVGDPGGLEDMRRAVAGPCQAWHHAWLARATASFARSPDALAEFGKAIEMDPRNGWYYAWRAEAKRLLRVSGGVFEDFELALANDPGGHSRSWILTWRGLARVEAGLCEPALEDFNAALAALPGYPLAHQGRSRAFWKLGRWRDWFLANEQACRLDPKYIQSLFARPLPELERQSEGLDLLAAESSPPAGLERWRGLYRVLLGRLEEARACLERAVAADAGDAWAWAWLGQARLQAGDDALEAFERALRLEPGNALMLAWRAKARLKAADLAGALADLDASLRADPRYAWAFSERGCLRLLRGDCAGAAADFERALSLDPRDAAAYADLAVARGRLGDAGGAARARAAAERLDAGRCEQRLGIWAAHFEGA